MELFPGDRVLVFNSHLYKNDVDTPLSVTMKPATILRRYGKKDWLPGMGEPIIYDDLVDVTFDHRPHQISLGHFTNSVRKI